MTPGSMANFAGNVSEGSASPTARDWQVEALAQSLLESEVSVCVAEYTRGYLI